MNPEEIKEFIKNEMLNNLTVKVKCGYGGYVSVEIYYNNQYVSSSSDNIVIDNDPEYN